MWGDQSGRLEPESLPGVAVGRNGSGYVLDIEWTELNDDWVGLRSERKTNQGQFLEFPIGL